MLGIAAGSYSDMLNGKYCGDKEGHLTKIEQFLDRETERVERPGQIQFTPTKVSNDIFKILRLNHIHGTMGGTIADSGVGKTEAFRQYALQNDNVIYVSASKWVVTHVQLSKKLSDILLRKAPRNTQDRCEAIVDKLSGSSRLLITVGQAVPWRPSPCGFAQICELRRTRVRLCYPCKNGRTRFALVRARDVASQQLLFEMANPFNRGQIIRQKSFKV